MTRDQEASLIEKVDKTHDAVIELRTLFDGGPGKWPSCVMQSEAITDLKKEVSQLSKQRWMAYGAVFVICPLASAVAVKFIDKLF